MKMATMTVKLSNEQTALQMLFEAGRLALEYRTGHASEYTPDGFASLEPLRFAVTRAGELLAAAENEERNLLAADSVVAGRDGAPIRIYQCRTQAEKP